MRVWFVRAAAAASLLAFGLTGCSDGGATTKVAQAQKVVLEAKSVTASGCVRPVETTSCLVVRGRAGGYYDISSASPAPDPTKGVAISLAKKRRRWAPWRMFSSAVASKPGMRLGRSVVRSSLGGVVIDGLGRG
ncbi:MAG: hypothetical protein B7Z44_04650 [Caulobacter sp. 12-67-6]|nr:MAG: hypothetical protein B7Z44_04650 [Caulobacter sp. 12-67-6]